MSSAGSNINKIDDESKPAEMPMFEIRSAPAAFRRNLIRHPKHTAAPIERVDLRVALRFVCCVKKD